MYIYCSCICCVSKLRRMYVYCSVGIVNLHAFYMILAYVCMYMYIFSGHYSLFISESFNCGAPSGCVDWCLGLLHLDRDGHGRGIYVHVHKKKTYLVGPDKLYKWSLGQRCFELISSHQQGILSSLSSTPPVYYICRVHRNTSGSGGSELMRFIHHIITYIVPATPRVINVVTPAWLCFVHTQYT